MKNKRITILGCGTWGSALAQVLADNGHLVTAWHHSKEKVAAMTSTRKHPHLANFKFSSNIVFENDLYSAVKKVDFIIIAVPSHVVRSIMEKIMARLQADSILVNVAKGVENGTLLTMSQVIGESSQHSMDLIVSLYGPSHSEEVIRNLPTTLVAASCSLKTAEEVQKLFSSHALRVYTNTDIIGVELGGSLKNIIAIAAGICDGIGFGDNTKAALLTRGITEITRLGIAMGAKADTFSGLSGIGDLIATCLSRHSRNRFVGEAIGKGRKLSTVLNEMDMVAEGIKTTQSVYDLMNKFNIEMPISRAVYNILFNGMDPNQAVTELMTRTLTHEITI